MVAGPANEGQVVEFETETDERSGKLRVSDLKPA